MFWILCCCVVSLSFVHVDFLVPFLVPPAISLIENVLVLGAEDAHIASCVAAGSKPPAVVRWNTTNLGEEVRITTNTTQHENGTTTVVSSLFGRPTMEINGGWVQCVVTSEALREEEILPLTIQLNCECTCSSLHKQ